MKKMLAVAATILTIILTGALSSANNLSIDTPQRPPKKANISDINAIIKIMHSSKLPEDIARRQINNQIEKGMKIAFFIEKGMVCFVSYFEENNLCGAIFEIKIYSYEKIANANLEIIAEEAVSNQFIGKVTFGEMRNKETIAMRLMEISPNKKIGEKYRNHWQKRYNQVVPLILKTLQNMLN